jgi:hypothetical protein
MADDVRVLELGEIVLVIFVGGAVAAGLGGGLGALIARTSTQGFSPVLL